MKPLAEKRLRAPFLAVCDALEERVLMSHGIVSPTPKATAADVDTHGQSASRQRATARWSWLANTYWYVPAPDTPAVLFLSNTQTLAPVLDQTVFHIAGYRAGYFWGVSVTQLDTTTPSSSSMIGSVTPQGRVLLNFTAMSGSSSPTITQGIGQMRLKAGQWTMENQMFTSPTSSAQLGHWAYMVQTRPGQPSWNSLPVAGVSVPQFLSNAPGPGPQPIGT